jgi:hypothetical protein
VTVVPIGGTGYWIMAKMDAPATLPVLAVRITPQDARSARSTLIQGIDISETPDPIRRIRIIHTGSPNPLLGQIGLQAGQYEMTLHEAATMPTIAELTPPIAIMQLIING